MAKELSVSVSLLIHARLLVWFVNEADYEFASAISNTLILGGLHLVTSFRDIRY